MLRALPEVAADFPDLVILPRDHHPSLGVIVEKLPLVWSDSPSRRRNVIFFNRFVDLKELTEFMGAADIYITPYLDESQISSGTLAYSFGSGKVVISTPYWHAAELLANAAACWFPLTTRPPLPKRSGSFFVMKRCAMRCAGRLTR